MRRAASVWPLLFLLAAQDGAKARLGDLEISLSNGHIRAGFELHSVFDEQLIERIQTGLPTGFDFRFKLIHPRRRWLDNTLATTSFQVLAMYNAVTQEYLVNFKQNGELIESRVALETDELRQMMTRFDDVTLFSTEGIEPSKRLRVRARAVLGARHLLFLIPTTVKTDWAESPRFRLSDGDLQ